MLWRFIESGCEIMYNINGNTNHNVAGYDPVSASPHPGTGWGFCSKGEFA